MTAEPLDEELDDEEQEVSAGKVEETVPAEEVPAGEVSTEEVVEEVVGEPEKEDELADLFTVPQPEDNDIQIDDLLEAPNVEEDDLSDLTDVTNEDIMGGEPIPRPEPKRKVVKRLRRTGKRYIPPPSPTMGGLRP